MSTLHACNTLSIVYRSQGKLPEAKKMYIQALKGYEEVLGAKDVSTLLVASNLGSLCSEQGESRRQERCISAR
jgi:hypothetical protein